MIGASALARCADATKDTSQSLSRYQQARNVLRQSSSAVGGEHFGLGALAVEAEGTGRGVAITLCPVVVVREKEGCLACLPWRGRSKEVGDKPLPVKELNDKGKHTPLDFGSGDGGGGRNQLEGRPHEVDMAVGEELNPLDAPRLRARFGSS